MKLCEECMKASRKLRDCLTSLERIHLLAAATSMGRSIHNGSGDSPELHKSVNSSVVTKLIFSLDAGLRVPMIQTFHDAVGIQISVDRCPHGALSVVS